MSQNQLQAPAWDLSSEYRGLDSEALASDVKRAKEMLKEIGSDGKKLEEQMLSSERSVSTAVALQKRAFALRTLLSDLFTFAQCEASVDGENAAARKLEADLQGLYSEYQEMLAPLAHFIALATESDFEAFLQDEAVAAGEFSSRKRRNFFTERLLTLSEEKLLAALAANGFHTWQQQYFSIAGSLKCHVERGGKTEIMGVSQTAGLLQNSDPKVREAAWRAINSAWSEHSESVCAGLNALCGWRHSVRKRRSAKRSKARDGPPQRRECGPGRRSG